MSVSKESHAEEKGYLRTARMGEEETFRPSLFPESEINLQVVLQ